MKKREFYIDVDKAVRLGCAHLIKVSLNGKRIRLVIAAKSGVNGFVEYLVAPLQIKGGKILTRKKRGQVKISINKVVSDER